MEIHPHPRILLKLHRRRSEIDLSPEYQRGVVWSKDKQQLLMDTILKKMHIPPIYFRVLENGYYECVDTILTKKVFCDTNIIFMTGERKYFFINSK